MRIFFLSVLLFIGPVAAAAQHPAWTDLATLFGLSKDSDTVTRFVRQHGLKEISKGPSGSFVPDDQAYSLLFQRGRIETIVIKVSPPPDGHAQDSERSYSAVLPFALTAEDARADVVAKLGHPAKPDGDRWHHDGFEVWVFFNDDDTAINELYICPVEKRP